MASWTTIKFEVDPSNASVYLNGTLAATRSFEGGQFALGNSSIFLGGVRSGHTLPEELHKYVKPFSGELRRLAINERPFDLHEMQMPGSQKRTESLSRARANAYYRLG
ncbi:hypothetical protein ANCDUO_12597 [Ancylostoma duodenale]|uniref:Laminin G domain-containing protein n=1 Tax=Ancylostoma duodenale TaxID=51022 RepID=A0A0C2CL02_9BILA|nr:hypothetical protein ANCDUO_12597 [Ancylostoma duodenale]